MHQYFKDGIEFLFSHKQLLYTGLLFILIPGLFIFSSQWFLSLAQENQERIERDRIALFQDTYSSLAQPLLTEPDTLQQSIEEIVVQNPAIEALAVVKKQKEGFVVVASKNPDLVGTIDTTNTFGYSTSVLQPDRSSVFTTTESGIRHWVAFRALPDIEGNVSHFLVTDISMAHIDAIASQNVLLAYSVLFVVVVALLLLLIYQARVTDYAALYQKLKALDQTKDDFISVAAHELRSPLTAIRGYAEILRDAGDLIPPQQTALERIEKSAEQLAYLIEDILDVARLQSGTMKFALESVPAHEVAHDVIDTLASSASEKGLTLRSQFESEAAITVDRTRLRQVLINLVGNAIKYTKEGSITVEIAQVKDKLQLAVRDTGIGISAKDQQQLFTKFFRVTSKDTEGIRGTGLGLWVTKNLVQEMGGELQLESMQGVGSRFFVEFPID